MPDINLLPPIDRQKERQEQERAKHEPKRVEIVLTNPPKPEKPPVSVAKLPRRSFWQWLTSGGTSKPNPPLPPKPPSLPSPSLFVKEPPKKVEPVAAPLAKAPRASFWRRLFLRKKSSPHAPLPPPLLPPKPSNGQASKVPSLNLLDKDDAESAPQLKPAQSPAADKHVKFTQLSDHPARSKEQQSEGFRDSVTLLPEDLRPREAHIETTLVATVLGSVIIATAIVSGALFAVNLFKLAAESDLDNAARQATSLSQQIKNKTGMKKEGEKFQRDIETVEALLDEHVYWTKWFDLLEKVTHGKVQWRAMGMDTAKREIHLSGKAATLSAVAEQIVALKSTPSFASVELSSASMGGKEEKENEEGESKGFTFDALLTLNETVAAEAIPSPEEESGVQHLQRGTITRNQEEALYEVQQLDARRVAPIDVRALFQAPSP